MKLIVCTYDKRARMMSSGVPQARVATKMMWPTMKKRTMTSQWSAAQRSRNERSKNETLSGHVLKELKFHDHEISDPRSAVVDNEVHDVPFSTDGEADELNPTITIAGFNPSAAAAQAAPPEPTALISCRAGHLANCRLGTPTASRRQLCAHTQ